MTADWSLDKTDWTHPDFGQVRHASSGWIAVNPAGETIGPYVGPDQGKRVLEEYWTGWKRESESRWTHPEYGELVRRGGEWSIMTLHGKRTDTLPNSAEAMLLLYRRESIRRWMGWCGIVYEFAGITGVSMGPAMADLGVATVFPIAAVVGLLVWTTCCVPRIQANAGRGAAVLTLIAGLIAQCVSGAVRLATPFAVFPSAGKLVMIGGVAALLAARIIGWWTYPLDRAVRRL